MFLHRHQTGPAGPEVASLSGRALFVVLPVEGGGHACYCRKCGVAVPLVGGQADARELQHAEGCSVGGLVARAGDKPVWLRWRAGEVRH
jgi:hypothetical protein